MTSARYVASYTIRWHEWHITEAKSTDTYGLQISEALRRRFVQLLNPLQLPVVPLRLCGSNVVRLDELQLMLRASQSVTTFFIVP